MIKTLYSKYFQKSRSFLYPQLGISRTEYPRPIQTFVAWKNHYEVTDMHLVCMYPKQIIEFDVFEKEMLRSHQLYVEDYSTRDHHGLYVFNLSDKEEDWNSFLKGKYSQFTKEFRNNVLNFYGIESAEYQYIESFLKPHKYIEVYSELLNVDPALLLEVGELCDPYNPESELLVYNEKDLEKWTGDKYLCASYLDK